MARGLLELYHPQLTTPAIQAIEDKEPKITAFVKEILQKTVEEKLTPELFIPEAATPILNGSKLAAEFLKSMGTLSKIELLEKQVQSDVRIYRYRLTYPSAKLIYTVVLKNDDKIAGLQFRPE